LTLTTEPFQCFPFEVIGWAYFQAMKISDPVQQLVSKGGWAYFRGWVYYQEITVLSTMSLIDYM